MAKQQRATWFKVFLHQCSLVDQVPDPVAGKALKAVMKYFQYGVVEALPPLEQLLFTSFRGNVDEAVADYLNSVERGRTGGRPRKKSDTDDPPHDEEPDSK